jgi:hypothetical protein
MVAYWEKRAFGELSREVDALSQAGKLFLLSEYIPVNQSATVNLAVVTSTAATRFHFFEIISTEAGVKASLVEAPTYTGSASTVVARNLNRNFPDTFGGVFENATSVTGGVIIATEFVGTDTKAGGSLSVFRTHTLKPSTKYVMRFENVGNKNTLVHFNLGLSESVPQGPQFWPV